MACAANPNPMPDASSTPVPPPTFTQALWVWVKIGLLSFGGPTGQIALMHQELVDRRRWISDSRFLHALNYCMLLPGPEAQQLAVYVGWLLHRTWGGVVAGTLFVLPGAALLWGISYIYVVFGDVPWMYAIFYGLKPAVMGIVAAAVIRIGAKVLKNALMWSVAAAAFVGIYFLELPFPSIILSAGLLGLVGGRFFESRFLVFQDHGGGKQADAVTDDPALNRDAFRPSARRTLRTATTWTALWVLPIVALGLWFGRDHVLFQQALFFSKAAIVTFGGAYAVLPYVAQQAVETHGWLSAAQMLDGLGLAETTPGPLILVLQYVGFLGGWAQPAPFSALAMASMASIVTTWCTFVPSFLWVLLGAPYIEAMRKQKLLTCALSTITAAVVGVVLNLAVWFGLSVLFPEPGTVDWFAVAVGITVFIGLAKFKWDVIPVVIGSGLLGLGYRMLL
jgi:chromate transporter